ncbi:MAG: hypothetical protein FJ293_07725 [Planctomycetes bacterium]|nr:hypothetical protein [Planctomycetota bacterium]
MNRTLWSRSRAYGLVGIAAGVSASALALSLAACGSGGGQGGTLSVTGTIFGYDPATGNFDASGQQGEAPLIPLNMCIVFDFSQDIIAATANSNSIVVQELDTSVSPPAAGPLAAATYTVTGNRLTICPLVTFTDTTAIFGWGDATDPNPKTYQILFQTAPSTTVMKSISGKGVASRDRGPYLFRTTQQIFDQKQGAPIPTMRLLHPVSGATVATNAVPTNPVPLIEITFDEPVIPSSAVDPGGVGTSSNIHVELDTDGDTNTTGDRVTIPGLYSLSQSGTSATVLFESLLTDLPTDLPTGCTYVVTVDGSVQDLSGNSKVSVSSDPGAEDVFTFVTVPGAATTPIAALAENFDDQANNDLSASSAKWGASFVGFLSPGIGGGTGGDGVFDPLNAGFQTSPPSGITVNVSAKLVLMATADGLGAQRIYEFTSFSVPGGWTVRPAAASIFPLAIQVSGSATITGTLSVGGVAASVVTGSPVAGGAGGASRAGGTAGGTGGAPSDAAGATLLFPNLAIGGTPTFPNYAFSASGAANQGVSGRTTALNTTASTLTDGNYSAQIGALSVTNLWIQPNVGADDYRFERYHTAFKVVSVNGSGVVTVVSDPTSADYRGELAQETENPYLEGDGAGGFRAPLLGEVFDAYVIGELAGKRGGTLFDVDLDGVLDDALVIDTAGGGSDPQAVMQTFLTLGRSGGGGGAGAIAAGSSGSDDPTVTNGPGFFGGTGNSGAAGGGAYPTATLLSRVDSDTLTLTTPLFDDGSGNPDAGFVGWLINPNIAQGNTFAIASVDSTSQVTITPITTSTGATINLLTTSMPPGSTVRVTAPYSVGGAGGGGAGMHCAGSSKVPANHTGHPDLTDSRNQNGAGNTTGFYDDDGGIAPPNQVQNGLEDSSESIFTLPRWIVGGGGGGGAGVLDLVVAGNVDISASGQILADGGEGGRSDFAGTTASSGGGGGAGGTIKVGSGGSIAVALGGRISAAGGVGGAVGFGNPGGAGGAGRIRLENSLGNLSPLNFIGVGTPALTAEHLGRFPGGGSSVAQSLFLPSGALNPDYQKLTISYSVTEDGLPITATYVVNADGTIDTVASNPDGIPFDLLLSATGADPATGLVDPATATAFVDPTTGGSTLADYIGLPFLRFKIVLTDPVTPVIIGGKSYTDVRIDSITIDVNSVKP